MSEFIPIKLYINLNFNLKHNKWAIHIRNDSLDESIWFETDAATRHILIRFICFEHENLKKSQL